MIIKYKFKYDHQVRHSKATSYDHFQVAIPMIGAHVGESGGSGKAKIWKLQAAESSCKQLHRMLLLCLWISSAHLGHPRKWVSIMWGFPLRKFLCAISVSNWNLMESPSVPSRSVGDLQHQAFWHGWSNAKVCGFTNTAGGNMWQLSLVQQGLAQDLCDSITTDYPKTSFRDTAHCKVSRVLYIYKSNSVR